MALHIVQLCLSNLGRTIPTMSASVDQFFLYTKQNETAFQCAGEGGYGCSYYDVFQYVFIDHLSTSVSPNCKFSLNICYNLCVTVKPVCNDHLYNKIYYLWFIQYCVLIKTEGTNLLLLTMSAFWGSSRWPLATKMSSRRQVSILPGGRCRQVSL